MTQFHFSNDGSHLRVDNTVTSIPPNAFSFNLKLKIVELPNSVTSIGKAAFQRCISLKEILLPDSLLTIRDGAFDGCTSLSQINIPSGVTELGKYPFRGCNLLKEIHLPDGLRSIGDEAFDGCTSLSRINIPSGVTEIGRLAFNQCISVNEVHLSDGLRIIGESSFSTCRSLTCIDIPSSVHTISNSAFHSCKLLKEVHLYNGLKTIGSNAFGGCTALRQIDIPATVNDIGDSMFEGCIALKEVHLSDGIHAIRVDTFTNCTTLLHVNIPSSVTDLEWGSCRRCPFLRNVFVSPSSTVDLFDFREAFSELQDMIDCSDNMIKARFDDLPIHRLCFFHSHHSMEHNNTYELLTKMVEQFPGHCTKGDCLGMTPLHILACSSTHDERLYQYIIDNYPESVLAKDGWGETPLAYLFIADAPNEILRYVSDAHKRMSDDVPFDFCAILTQLVTSNSAEYVRRMIQTQRINFPGLDVDWQYVMDEMNDVDNIDISDLDDHYFMYQMYRVYQVIAEASLSARFNSLSTEHRQELDQRMWDLRERDSERLRVLHEIDDYAYPLPPDPEIEINVLVEIRNWTTRFVQLHRDFMMGASLALELAIWKWARMDVRSNCGNICQVIIPNVLPFLQFECS